MSTPTKAKQSTLAAVHSGYQAYADDWRKCRDFIAGTKALRRHDLENWRDSLATIRVRGGNVKSSREPVNGATFEGKVISCYIPPLSNRMTFAEYVLYLFRGHYYNIVEVTKTGYLGQLFGHPAEVELPPGADILEQDIDLKETPLLEFVEKIVDEVLAVGRCGVLVDRPASAQEVTVADAQKLGLHPFGALYRTEDILDWKVERSGARYVLTYVRVRESVLRSWGQDWNYRELKLDADGYSQIEWTRDKKDDDYSPKTITPTMGAEQRFKAIPFYPFSPRGGGVEIEPPPLLDLVDMAHEHYQANVEYAAARFSAAIPTPCFFGFRADELDDVVLGGQSAVFATNPEAHADYLQTGADGLQPLRDAIKDIEERAAKIGSRALTTEKAAAEAAATVRIRKSGETVTLSDIANSASRIMTQLLTFACAWNNTPGDVQFRLPTEFDDWLIESADFGTLYKAYSEGRYTETDWIRLLKKRRFVDSDRDELEIAAELEEMTRRKQEDQASQLTAAVEKAKAQAGKAVGA